MVDINRKILKALGFLEKNLNQLNKNKENWHSDLSPEVLFFFANGFIFNYLKISSFYFKEESLFFISREEQNLASVSLKKFEENIESKDLDSFILASQNWNLSKKQEIDLYTHCHDILATSFTFLLKHVNSDFYSKELKEIEQNNQDLQQLEREPFSTLWLERFYTLFPTSFKKLKKNVIFLSHLLVLREKKVKVLVHQIRKKKTGDFLDLVLLDHKIFHLLHATNFSLSSLIDVLRTVKAKKTQEIVSHYYARLRQIYQEFLKENKKDWTDSFNPFYKSLRDEKLNRSFNEVARQSKREEELLKKRLKEVDDIKYEKTKNQ